MSSLLHNRSMVLFIVIFSIFRSLVDVLPHFFLLCLLSLHSLLYNVMHSVCRYFSAYIFVHELCFCNVDAMTNYTFISVVSYLSRIANNLIDAEILSCRSHKQTIWVDCASQQKNGLWFTQQFVEYHHPPYAKCTCDNPFRSHRCHFYIPNTRWKFVFCMLCMWHVSGEIVNRSIRMTFKFIPIAVVVRRGSRCHTDNTFLNFIFFLLRFLCWKL